MYVPRCSFHLLSLGFTLTPLRCAQMITSMGYDPAKIHDESPDVAPPKECVFCLDKVPDHIIMDCMHICVCEDCAETLQSKNNPTCPVCRAPVNAIKKVFL